METDALGPKQAGASERVLAQFLASEGRTDTGVVSDCLVALPPSTEGSETELPEALREFDGRFPRRCV